MYRYFGRFKLHVHGVQFPHSFGYHVEDACDMVRGLPFERVTAEQQVACQRLDDDNVDKDSTQDADIRATDCD